MKEYFVIAFLVSLAITGAPADDKSLKISVGTGFTGNFWQVDQKMSAPDYTGLERKDTARAFGFKGFVDISPFFSCEGGFRVLSSTLHGTLAFSGSNEAWDSGCSVTQYEVAVEGKYPIVLWKVFSFAPKAGLEYVGYTRGQINGAAPSDDEKARLSPLYATLGLDLNYYFNKNLFIRVPVTLGYALNARLSDSFYYAYGGASYSSAVGTMVEAGIDIGYTF